MGSRRTTAWLPPVRFSVTVAAIAVLVGPLPRGMRNGDPAVVALIGGLALPDGRFLGLGLTDRCARKQVR